MEKRQWIPAAIVLNSVKNSAVVATVSPVSAEGYRYPSQPFKGYSSPLRLQQVQLAAATNVKAMVAPGKSCSRKNKSSFPS